MIGRSDIASKPSVSVWFDFDFVICAVQDSVLAPRDFDLGVFIYGVWVHIKG